MVAETEATLREKGVDFVAGRANYADLPRGEIIGDQTGFLKLLFRREDMRLLGVQPTERVHVGLIAMLAEAGAELFNRECFNYPTLGDLYKYAAYDALRSATASDPSNRRPSRIQMLAVASGLCQRPHAL